MQVPLFLNDYCHLGEEHFEFDTKNKSFIKMYYILKKMGINNNKFHLLLFDTSLRGIDPFNLPNDDIELKLRIIHECKINPWYFFRNICRVPASGTDGIPFRLSRASLSLVWLFLNHIDQLLIMPRQQGKTISTTAIWAYVIFIASNNCNISMLTKDTKLRKENVDRLKDIRDALPGWMVHKQRKDTESREEISYEVLNNKYQTYVAQMSLSGAEKIGRGMTTPIQHWDETAYFKNIAITYPVAISTTTAAIESAKRIGAPYGNILTTTAGKLNTDEGIYTHNLICDALLFTELLYDMKDWTELNDTVRTNSTRGLVYSEFSYSQLGKSEEWFRQEAARLGDEDVIDRDLLNKWTFGSLATPIEKHLRDKIYASRKDPDFTQKIDEFIIRWYITRDVVLGHELGLIPIIIGLDASSNVGRDFTSFVFLDGRSLKPIATCSCNTTNIIKVAMFIVRWLKLPNVVFIPERNHVGSAIVDYCLLELDKMGICPFFKIYNDIIQEWRTNKNTLSKSDLVRPGSYDSYRKNFGFKTTTETRSFIYKTVFRRALELAGDHIGDKTLINQIGGLTIRNGRIDHPEGGNDDSVVAYLMGAYLLFYGDNLDLYTFSNGNTDWLLKNTESQKEVKPGHFMSQDEIETIQYEIKLLQTKIRNTDHQTIKIELLHKVNELKSRLPEEEKDSLPDKETVSQLNKKFIPAMINQYESSRQLQNYFAGGM